MPKPIVFIAALLLALPAFAQTRMPARQVEADTNMVNIAISLPFTVQAALDWIDANWPALSSESWSNLDPAEDTVQSVFDWVDDNWQAVDDSGWLILDPESPTTQSVFDWIDAYMGIDTNGWGYLAPTASTAQATFTWLDERFSGFGPDDVIMPGSNIANAAYDPATLTWGGLMKGTNIVGATYTPSNMTWTVDPDYYFSLLSQNTMVAVRNTDITNSPVGGNWGMVVDYDAAIGATNLFSLEEGVFTVDQPGYYGASAVFITERSVPGDNETEWGFAISSSTSFTPSVELGYNTEEGVNAGSGYAVFKAEKNDTFYVTYYNEDPISPSNKIIRVIFSMNLLSTY